MRIVPALALVGMFAAILTFSTRVTWADPSIQDFAKLCRNDPIIQESNILPLIEDGLKKHPESFPNVSSREILAIAVKEHVQKCTVRSNCSRLLTGLLRVGADGMVDGGLAA